MTSREGGRKKLKSDFGLILSLNVSGKNQDCFRNLENMGI